MWRLTVAKSSFPFHIALNSSVLPTPRHKKTGGYYMAQKQGIILLHMLIFSDSG
jgi:hypothetical protein